MDITYLTTYFSHHLCRFKIFVFFVIFYEQKYKEKGKTLVGSFSAASNITGVLNDTDAIAAIMHKYGGYAFFDYATAGPYLEMNMNPHNSDL